MRNFAALVAAVLMPSVAMAAEGPHRLSITSGAVAGAFDYDALSARNERACMDAGIQLVNDTSSAVSVDLFEAQTDVAFPFGRLAAGSTKSVPMTRPARIVVVDAQTGHALALVSVEDCRRVRR